MSQHPHVRRTAIAGMAGNVLEWYDLAVYGYFAARIGIHKILLISAGLGIVTTIPLFWLIDHHDPMLEFLGQLGIVLIFAPFIANFGTHMAFLFPKAIRLSAFSTTYKIGLAVLGGTAPLAARSPSQAA